MNVLNKMYCILYKYRFTLLFACSYLVMNKDTHILYVRDIFKTNNKTHNKKCDLYIYLSIKIFD